MVATTEKEKGQVPQIPKGKKEPPTKTPASPKGEKFEPTDITTEPVPYSGLPPEIWTIVQSARANFTPNYFLDTSRNLLENPNLTASHLARAELSYTSFTDATFNPNATHPHDLAAIIKHLKPDHQPLLMPGGTPPDYTLTWTAVRKLIPRNPKVDDPLLQTCHLFTSTAPTPDINPGGTPTTQDTPPETERYLIIYLPHATGPQTIPFYHPKVRALAILYTFRPSLPQSGTLSLYYSMFPDYPLDNRLTRTALHMLEIMHKHARGRAAGYQKRVHHDVVIAQKPFQDTYMHLKGKYAAALIEGWVEQTPPEKHVFEDLGIAAFLVELWKEMYGRKLTEGTDGNGQAENDEARAERAKDKFPGFVDIGCGNGLLVKILNDEGWEGWGFDARARKTWETFDVDTRGKLKEMLLVPEVLASSSPESEAAQSQPVHHNGIFPDGTFIISNHADELTLWTPLLAYLSSSPFIAIPCCSHDFGGIRFRAPNKYAVPFLPLGQVVNKAKQPSAYASLCGYLFHLTEATGFVAEKEYLRIPSTRNVAVIGQTRKIDGNGKGENLVEGMDWDEDREKKLEDLKRLVVREMTDCSIDQIRMQWVKRVSGLTKEKGGH